MVVVATLVTWAVIDLKCLNVPSTCAIVDLAFVDGENGESVDHLAEGKDLAGENQRQGPGVGSGTGLAVDRTLAGCSPGNFGEVVTTNDAAVVVDEADTNNNNNRQLIQHQRCLSPPPPSGNGTYSSPSREAAKT